MPTAITRLLVTFALVLLFTACALANAGWDAVAARVVKSIASVQQPVVDPLTGAVSQQNVCSAFTIDSDRQLLLTAYHCLADGLTVDRQIAWTVYANAELDLAVVMSPGVRRPAVTPRRSTPLVVGEPIAAMEYAYGLESPMFRASVVSHPYMLIPGRGYFLVYAGSFIGGMSGGPIIDAQGEVVGIVQLGNHDVGLGKPIEVILAATAPFWPL